MISFSTINSALDIIRYSAGLKHQVFQSHVLGKTALRELLSQLKPAGGVDPVRDFDQIAAKISEQSTVNAEMVISAAAIVLAHSTADDVFTAVCKIAILARPAEWISELNLDRKVTLRDLTEKGQGKVFEEQLKALGSQLSAKSLPNRAEILFRHLPIKENKNIKDTDPEHFRMSRLKELDELRTRIVHGSGIQPAIPLKEGRQGSSFLYESACTAMRSLGTAYSIPLDTTLALLGKDSGATGA